MATETCQWIILSVRVLLIKGEFTYSCAPLCIRVHPPTLQEVGLNYHVKCEQVARFATGNFFNFSECADHS